MSKDLSTNTQIEGELREKPWPQWAKPDLSDREPLWLRGVHDGLALLESWIHQAILQEQPLEYQRIQEWIRQLKAHAEDLITEYTKIRLLAFDPPSK